eukprot:scaffold12862_cov102-Cyclotella_meneghiniana.AAC.7
MGCSYSYPLPDGKFMNDSTIPKQIDVKQNVLDSGKVNVVEMKAVATTPRLSPLRSLINTSEIARPQSEETRRIRERLSTELMTSINTDLDVIDEDPHPQHRELKIMFDSAAEEESRPALTSPSGKRTIINKLSESALIEVFTIECKAVQSKSRVIIGTSSTVSVDESKVLPAQPMLPPKEESQNEEDKALVCTTMRSIKLKDRVLIATAVLILLVFYTTSIALFVWLGSKTVQSMGYFVTTSFLSNEAMLSLINESEVISTTNDPTDVWTLVQHSNPMTTKGTATNESIGLELLENDKEKFSEIISLKLRERSSSVTNDIITTVRSCWDDRRNHTQAMIQSVMQMKITLKQVTDYVEEGHYFI